MACSGCVDVEVGEYPCQPPLARFADCIEAQDDPPSAPPYKGRGVSIEERSGWGHSQAPGQGSAPVNPLPDGVVYPREDRRAGARP